MPTRKVETPGLELVAISVGPDWRIQHHRLFNVTPDDAEKVEVIGEGFTVWDLCFLEDLLQIVNLQKGMLLDVGWYPHADPDGTFRLRLVPTDKDDKSRFNWRSPITDFKTRSMTLLLAEIHKIVSA